MEKEWLKIFATINEDILLLEIKRDCLNIAKERWQSQGDLSKNNSLDMCVKQINKINKDINDIEDILDSYRQQKIKVEQWIADRKGIEAKIIKLYYKDCLTLKQIAVKLNYSEDHIRRVHSKLLKKL